MDKKFLFEGVVFCETGTARFHRNFLKALEKREVDFQVFDLYDSMVDCDGGMKKWFSPLDLRDKNLVQMLTYNPDVWQFAHPFNGPRVAFVVHEGNRLFPGWSKMINSGISHLLVPSKATKNLFFSNGVRCPISVVPLGVDTLVFNPDGDKANFHLDYDDAYVKKHYPKLKDPFMFLCVNSWTGDVNDRKGTDLVVRAFSEEFSRDENVLLYLKVSTFWANEFNVNDAVKKISPPGNRPMIVSTNSKIVLSDVHLAELYRCSDCFVTATKGESFGFTIAEAMSCGLPVVVPRNDHAGYMDFTKDSDGVFYVDCKGWSQADRRFFAEGNTMPEPDVASLRKQMRKVFNMKKSERERVGLKNSEVISKGFTWEHTVDRFVEVMK